LWWFVNRRKKYNFAAVTPTVVGNSHKMPVDGGG